MPYSFCFVCLFLLDKLQIKMPPPVAILPLGKYRLSAAMAIALEYYCSEEKLCYPSQPFLLCRCFPSLQ